MITSIRRRCCTVMTGCLFIAVTACASDKAAPDALNSDVSPTARTNSGSDDGELPGTTFEIESGTHVDGPVEYPQTPPVGGNHSPEWQNCGVYTDPVANEPAVHALEHGAVWITNDAALDPVDVDTLAGYAANQTHVLVSPFEGLPASIVASAWGVQQEFDSATDPGIVVFIQTYQLGAQSPEPGAPCSNGVGEPS